MTVKQEEVTYSPELEGVKAREIAFYDGVQSWLTKKEAVSIPFSLGKLYGNRELLRPGDVIHAEDGQSETVMGLLSLGLTTRSRCFPLYYLQDGVPVVTTDLDLHHVSMVEPRIEYVASAIKPTDNTRGISHLFVPTEASIIRPTGGRLQYLNEEYAYNKFWADTLFTFAAAIPPVVGGGGVLLNSTMETGSVPLLLGESVFATLPALGLLRASNHFRRKGEEAYCLFQQEYPEIFPRQLHSLIKDAFNRFNEESV